MSNRSTQKIGDSFFGVSPDEQARSVEWVSAEVAGIHGWGLVPLGTTFYDVADVILDTISGYSQMGDITIAELPSLIRDALEQLQGKEDQ